MARHLVILSSGRRDGGQRAALALGIATSALALGDEVTVFLAQDAVCWASPDCSATVCPPGDRPLSEQVREFLELGGRLLVCSRCVEGLCEQPCPVDRTLFPGIELAGLASIAELAVGAVVYTF